MPRLPKLRVRVLEDLARQLRFEPAQAARRHLQRAEALAAQLLEEPSEQRPEAYPEDWVVFRITGLRSAGTDGGKEPAMVVRAALLGDIGALIDRLSSAADIRAQELGAREWLSVDELSARWNVSRKTLERYRRKGLVSRRVTIGRGRERVVFSRAIVEAFEKGHSPVLAEARAFKRMDAAARQLIIRRARRYHARLGCSLHACAQRLAPRVGRTVEAVRQVLVRHDETSDDPIFSRAAPIRADEAARIERLSRRGGDLAKAAALMRRSRSAAYRVTQDQRARRLKELALHGPFGAMFSRPDAEQVLLSHPTIAGGLGRPFPLTAGACEAVAEATEPESASDEIARSAGYWYLRWSCLQHLSRLPRHGARGADVDAIETRLLWASRVKLEAVREQLPLVVRTIESQLGVAATTLPSVSAGELLNACIQAAADGFDRFDPFKGGRLAAPTSVAVGRAISQWLRAHPATEWRRAGSMLARPDHRGAVLADWPNQMNAWQAWLELPPGLANVSTLDARTKQVLVLRGGWTGNPPQTFIQIAGALNTTPTRVAAIQRAALAQFFGTVRSTGRTSKRPPT